MNPLHSGSMAVVEEDLVLLCPGSYITLNCKLRGLASKSAVGRVNWGGWFCTRLVSCREAVQWFRAEELRFRIGAVRVRAVPVLRRRI